MGFVAFSPGEAVFLAWFSGALGWGLVISPDYGFSRALPFAATFRPLALVVCATEFDLTFNSDLQTSCKSQLL